MSDPNDKEDKIVGFRKELFDLLKDTNKTRKNVHMMDETGLYSDSILLYTWTFYDDDQAYVCSSGVKRRDTLVATISGNGKGFATFKRHQNHRTRTRNQTNEIIDPGVKCMNIIEMKKWIKKFKEYALPGDILIMNNLSSHRNKEVLKELHDYQIHVLFLPARCADVLSVLDNCFFAVFKAKWYEEIVFGDDIDQKEERAISLFDSLIETKIGKRMYHRCGYDSIFNDQNAITDVHNE